jgi:thiosulfate reductase cytochrome b subunit
MVLPTLIAVTLPITLIGGFAILLESTFKFLRQFHGLPKCFGVVNIQLVL